MNSPDTSSAAFFETKYQHKADPWNFASDRYELRRYDAIMAALAGRVYGRAFEPACSVGVLTRRLASICKHVEACDFSQTAVAQAQERCVGVPNVVIECASLAERLPAEDFDLVVLSELGYYFYPLEWHEIVEQMVSRMARGTVMLASHWLGTSADHRMDGEQVHDLIQVVPSLRLQYSERHEGFRLDRWNRI